MNRLITIFSILSLSVCALFAQTERGIGIADTLHQSALSDNAMLQEDASNTHIAEPSPYVTEPNPLKLPILTTQGKMIAPWGFYPSWGGWHNWRLHEGLNVSLGASVFSTFGSGHSWSGAGFSQSVALMYAMPLTQKLSLAIGGYFGNMSWAHTSWQDAGISAVLGYQFDEHWSAYVYGQKSFVETKPMPMHLRDMSELGDRLGIAVRYDFNPSFSIQMSFDAIDTPVYSPVPMPIMRGKTNAMQNNTLPPPPPLNR